MLEHREDLFFECIELLEHVILAGLQFGQQRARLRCVVQFAVGFSHKITGSFGHQITSPFGYRITGRFGHRITGRFGRFDRFADRFEFDRRVGCVKVRVVGCRDPNHRCHGNRRSR